MIFSTRSLDATNLPATGPFSPGRISVPALTGTLVGGRPSFDLGSDSSEFVLGMVFANSSYEGIGSGNCELFLFDAGVGLSLIN